MKISLSRSFLIFSISSLIAVSSAFATSTKNVSKDKYGKGVAPLSLDNSYLRRAAAPDYWALQGHVSGQPTNSACSIAVVATMMNGIRTLDGTGKNEKHLTVKSVLEKVNEQVWTDAVKNNGGGISLVQFQAYLTRTFEAFGYSAGTVRQVDVKTDADLASFVSDLATNEKSSADFMVINFDQGFVMDDDSVGHFALIGAYDARSNRVLVLDPDKQWYEPYWAPVPKVFESLIGRGYVVATPKP